MLSVDGGAPRDAHRGLSAPVNDVQRDHRVHLQHSNSASKPVIAPHPRELGVRTHQLDTHAQPKAELGSSGAHYTTPVSSAPSSALQLAFSFDKAQGAHVLEDSAAGGGGNWSQRKSDADVPLTTASVTANCQWLGRSVRVTRGKGGGTLGVVTKSGHGFYFVSAEGGRGFMKRGHEIELVQGGSLRPKAPRSSSQGSSAARRARAAQQAAGAAAQGVPAAGWVLQMPPGGLRSPSSGAALPFACGAPSLAAPLPGGYVGGARQAGGAHADGQYGLSACPQIAGQAGADAGGGGAGAAPNDGQSGGLACGAAPLAHAALVRMPASNACEECSALHPGSFGSGRFCSRSCGARYAVRARAANFPPSAAATAAAAKGAGGGGGGGAGAGVHEAQAAACGGCMGGYGRAVHYAAYPAQPSSQPPGRPRHHPYDRPQQTTAQYGGCGPQPFAQQPHAALGGALHHAVQPSFQQQQRQYQLGGFADMPPGSAGGAPWAGGCAQQLQQQSDASQEAVRKYCATAGQLHPVAGQLLQPAGGGGGGGEADAEQRQAEGGSGAPEAGRAPPGAQGGSHVCGYVLTPTTSSEQLQQQFSDVRSFSTPHCSPQQAQQQAQAQALQQAQAQQAQQAQRQAQQAQAQAQQLQQAQAQHEHAQLQMRHWQQHVRQQMHLQQAAQQAHQLQMHHQQQQQQQAQQQAQPLGAPADSHTRPRMPEPLALHPAHAVPALGYAFSSAAAPGMRGPAHHGAAEPVLSSFESQLLARAATAAQAAGIVRAASGSGAAGAGRSEEAGAGARGARASDSEAVEAAALLQALGGGS